MQGRTKVSVSLPSELVERIDRGVRERLYPSRSAAVEEALRRLERVQRDLEIEAYYAGRSEAERAEERAWAELGAEGLAVSLRAAEQPAGYGRTPRGRRPRRKGR